ncbi:MAG TPA: endonuclease/exonuclease/phosphatase family protein [Verrucomicrobiae bacterium]|nr:endonuclease/exonuclease/phosphatase family protein [Verrucomicrobiae bacterium]
MNKITNIIRLPPGSGGRPACRGAGASRPADKAPGCAKPVGTLQRLLDYSRLFRAARCTPSTAGGTPAATRCFGLLAVSLTILMSIVGGCATKRPETASTTLRVMTFNIQHGAGADNKIDLLRTAEAIKREKPDIVALQEVDRGVARTNHRNLPLELQAMTGMPVYFTNNFHFQGGEYGNAVLTRFPILMQTNTYYKMIRTNEQRGIIQMILDVHGRKLLFMTTHIDYRPDNKERLMNVAQIKEITKQYPGLPVILCGDFNETPKGRVYGEMKKSFADAWQIAGEGEGLTFPSPKPIRRIDYIWVSADKSVEPLVTWVPDTKASDHRPLVAELRLK